MLGKKFSIYSVNFSSMGLDFIDFFAAIDKSKNPSRDGQDAIHVHGHQTGHNNPRLRQTEQQRCQDRNSIRPTDNSNFRHVRSGNSGLGQNSANNSSVAGHEL